uniref:Uncharacterized protein n=1 Tax=viral metagenome TaxID=1070528 RepID=A0A6C0L1V8_9ZZZZ|tara:strand:+ start:4621 stop:5859 length:1239 start_codon:yes stop_codon:yes gene_type:complete
MFHNYSERVQEIIIELGCSMYKQLGFDTLTEEEIILKYNHGANAELIRETYEERISHLEESYAEKLNLEHKMSNDTIDSLRKRISENDKISDLKVNEIVLHQEKVHNLEKEQLYNEIKHLQKNKDVQEFLEERFCDKTDFENPTEQGDHVENMFNEIVNSQLPFDDKATIDDTSTSGGSGDRIIRFSNGFVLMIEVKNKGIIKKTDIDEFQTHYTKDLKEKKIDCALFFSYRTTTIPNICKALVNRYFDNERVVYFGTNDNLTPQEKRERMIQCIEEIYIKFSDKKGKEKDNGSNVSLYNEHLRVLKEQKIDYQTKIKDSEKNVVTYNERLSKIDRQMNMLCREIQINKVDVDKSLLDDKIYKAQLIERIKQWRETSPNGQKKEWKKHIKLEIEMSDYDHAKLKTIRVTDLQ